MLARQRRRGLALEARQIVDVVIERLQRAIPRIAQYLVESAALRFACEERDAHLLGGAHLGRHFGQHREATAHVKSADTHRQPGCEKRPRQIDSPWELVRLHADETNQRTAARLADHPDYTVWTDASVGLVVRMKLNINPGAEHFALAGVFGE